tara:strand:- start:729 stop:1169 length:441 start_codon:yes stop_codon:yes gene_type:complete
MMFCTECGNKADVDHRFCSNCGSYLDKTVAELAGSAPAFEPEYRVSYSSGSWLSRLSGRIILTIMWLGIGVGLTAIVFIGARRFDIVIAQNVRLAAAVVIGLYWAYTRGWNSKRFAGRIDVDDAYNDELLDDDSDNFESDEHHDIE